MAGQAKVTYVSDSEVATRIFQLGDFDEIWLKTDAVDFKSVGISEDAGVFSCAASDVENGPGLSVELFEEVGYSFDFGVMVFD